MHSKDAELEEKKTEIETAHKIIAALRGELKDLGKDLEEKGDED